MHAWPLSWVERLRLEDGRQLAYKTQLPPTVEPEFYASARSPLLIGHRDLGRVGACHAMVLEWLDAPPGPTPAQELVEHIGAIEGDPPAALDIGGEERWTAEVQRTVETLVRLADAQAFEIGLADIERVATWAGSLPVLRAIERDARLVHGDLTPAHVFATPDGPRVIGWRRPVIGPPALDLVPLAADVDPAVTGIFWFLRLRWAAVLEIEPWAAEAVAGILAAQTA